MTGLETGFSNALLALLAGFLPCAVLHFTFGLGMGDAKFIGAMGALLASWESVAAMVVYGLLAGVVTSVVILVLRGQAGSFGRNVRLILIQAAAFRRPETPSVHTVPFCLPMAIGAALAGAEQLLGLPVPWGAYSIHAPWPLLQN